MEHPVLLQSACQTDSKQRRAGGRGLSEETPGLLQERQEEGLGYIPGDSETALRKVWLAA